MTSPSDLSDRRFDFHSHILPALDHGCADIFASLRQLEFASLAGVTHIIATSHFYASDCPLSSGISISEFAEMREAAFQVLKSEYSGNITVIPGCEAHLTRGLLDADNIDALCINGSRSILVEPDFHASESSVVDMLSSLINDRGLRPIIAHIDRYGVRMLRVFHGMGLDIQINADAAAGFFTFRHYRKSVRDGAISLLGSDVHDNPDLSYRLYKRAVAAIGDSIARFDKRAAELCGIDA